MYDAQEQLVFDSEISVAVIGRAGDFVLIDLTDNIDDAVVETARARRFGYCGVLALINGEPVAKCESDADAVYTMMHAGLAFTRMMADKLSKG